MIPNTITKTLKIDGMTCVSCENRIERKTAKHKGNFQCEGKVYDGKKASVTFDERVIRLEKIITIIEQLDYKVVKAVPNTLSQNRRYKNCRSRHHPFCLVYDYQSFWRFFHL